jgi:hypothetical protein
LGYWQQSRKPFIIFTIKFSLADSPKTIGSLELPEYTPLGVFFPGASHGKALAIIPQRVPFQLQVSGFLADMEYCGENVHTPRRIPVI